jgi:2-polyprenyl-6-methoxyphenol hydroxylase-like FAD-dependent oxidoreductase
VGADGINSVVRNIIMRDRKLPEIKPSHCGYAYFRSVVDLSDRPSANNQWHNYAFESWGEEKRFGYVPLKQPKTFWFFSVPINK